MKNRQGQRGFTLLELTIVLTIIAVIAGMGVATSLSILESARQTSTDNRMDAVEKALLAFRRANNRLPCPADATLTTGAELPTPGTCTGVNFSSAGKAFEGAVPYAAIGLTPEFMYDGWGRKIAYAVTPEFTKSDAFTRIAPQTICTAGTAITISDASDLTGASGARSTSAAYALVSFGPNGHGGYLASGTRFSAGSTNQGEQTNCHCNASAAAAAYDGNYVQTAAVLDTTTPANYFDDILRYKERWQLATQEDAMNDSGYRGPTLAVGFSKAVTGQVYTYKPGCGSWVQQSALPTAPPTQIPRAVAFTAANQHLLTYSAAGCRMFKFTGSTGVAELGASVVPSCSYNAAGVMALSNNGYLAIYDGTNIKFWKQAGDAFVKLSTTIAASPTSLSFSRNANFLVLDTGTVYIRKGDNFTSLGIPTPNGAFTAPITSYAFSPNGRYLGATNATKIQIWRVPMSSSPVIADFVALTPLTPAAPAVTNQAAITFSPDGRYLATGGGSASGANIIIYKIDQGDLSNQVAEVFTELATPTGWSDAVGTAGTGFAFSADSSYLLMLTTASPAVMFRRTGNTSFEYVSGNVPVLAGATGASAAFGN